MIMWILDIAYKVKRYCIAVRCSGVFSVRNYTLNVLIVMMLEGG